MRSLKRNPYSFRYRYESIQDRIIVKFLDILEPFFHGQKDEVVGKGQAIMETSFGQTECCEWTLHQTGVDLLWKDYKKIIVNCLPCPTLHLFQKLSRYVEIFFHLDLTDEDLNVETLAQPELKELIILLSHGRSTWKGKSTWTGSRIIHFRNAILLITSKIKRKANFFKTNIKYSLIHIDRIIGISRIIARYYIRGPSFIKNILLFSSNNRK